MAKETTLMEKLMALCKRRGFIFQSSEIYGGINGFWDYGPLGVELKRNIKDAWWYDMVTCREDVVGLGTDGDDQITLEELAGWQGGGVLDVLMNFDGRLPHRYGAAPDTGARWP